MIRTVTSAAILLTVLLFSVCAHADPGELLNFGGLGDMQTVGNFYNGGGLSSTPNYGITFSSNFFGLKSFYQGGSGNFATTPTTTAAIFIYGPTGSPATGVMNVGPGFTTGLNFYFTAGFTGNQTATVTIWSGANGTGSVLATITLGNNNGACSGFPSYCTWSNIGTSFSGTAHSVTFTGPANELGLADITIGGKGTAIPESSSMYLLGIGLMAISVSKPRRLFGAKKESASSRR
jgi:hypothetical protein